MDTPSGRLCWSAATLGASLTALVDAPSPLSLTVCGIAAVSLASVWSGRQGGNPHLE